MPTLTIYFGRDAGTREEAAADARANQADFLIYQQRLFVILGFAKPACGGPHIVASAEIAEGPAAIGQSLLNIMQARGAAL